MPGPDTPELPGQVITIEDLGEPTAKFDPRPGQEVARSRIAYLLIGTLVATIAASFIGLWFNWMTSAELDAVMKLVFGPLVGLVGAVTGFYYGGKSG
jgi:hypothetical protein